MTSPTSGDQSGRPDTSSVDLAVRDYWVKSIGYILTRDADEYEIAEELRGIDAWLNKVPEMYCAVFDELAAQGVITKAQWRVFLKVEQPEKGVEL